MEQQMYLSFSFEGTSRCDDVKHSLVCENVSLLCVTQILLELIKYDLILDFDCHIIGSTDTGDPF